MLKEDARPLVEIDTREKEKAFAAKYGERTALYDSLRSMFVPEFREFVKYDPILTNDSFKDGSEHAPTLNLPGHYPIRFGVFYRQQGPKYWYFRPLDVKDKQAGLHYYYAVLNGSKPVMCRLLGEALLLAERPEVKSRTTLENALFRLDNAMHAIEQFAEFLHEPSQQPLTDPAMIYGRALVKSAKAQRALHEAKAILKQGNEDDSTAEH